MKKEKNLYFTARRGEGSGGGRLQNEGNRGCMHARDIEYRISDVPSAHRKTRDIFACTVWYLPNARETRAPEMAIERDGNSS